jgi:F-type H+-transporting ATPase subunit a
VTGWHLDETAPVSHPTIGDCGSLVNGLIKPCALNVDTLISSAIAIVVTLVAAIYIARQLQPGHPSKLNALFEWMFLFVRRTANENAPDYGFVVPLAATIGFYILVANYLDFLPITVIHNVKPAMADVNQTAAMAIVVFILVNAYSIRVRGLKGYLHHFTRPMELPLWARILFIPLNIVEELVKPVTLTLRLFGNIFAGLLMAYVITFLLGGIGIPVLVVWKLFDVLFIGLIQAFIFMLLTMIYFGLAREGLEEHAHH